MSNGDFERCIDCSRYIPLDREASCPFHRPQAHPLCVDCLDENHTDCEEAAYRRGALKS